MLAENDRLRPGGSVTRKWPQKRASHDAKSHKVLGQALWKMADSASLGDRRHYVDGVSAAGINTLERRVSWNTAGAQEPGSTNQDQTVMIEKPQANVRRVL